MALGLFVSGCGLNLQAHYAAYRPQLLSGDFDGAVSYIETQKEGFYGFKNRLLYYLDRAMALHLAGRYRESNRVLEQAKQAADELWTESVTEHAAAWFTTDNSLSYSGEDFEKVLIHWLAAQNNLALRDHGAARVEARQITNKLELYNQKYEALETTANLYRDDAFARWLAGMLAETEPGFSALNDAWIDYRRAIEVYRDDYARYDTPVPRQLVADALRVLDGLGPEFAAERRALGDEFPTVTAVPPNEAATRGRVVLVHAAGEAPQKIDDFWTYKEGKNILRIAFPKYVPQSYRVATVRLIDRERVAPAELAENITGIAMQNLADHMSRIRAKAITRAILKYAVGRTAQEVGKATGGEGGGLAQLAGTAWNIGQAVAEEADKRTWVTLPARINVSEIWVPPGTGEVRIEYLDASGQHLESLDEVRSIDPPVKAGEAVFIPVRTFR